MEKPTHLIWDESFLTIVPGSRSIKALLTAEVSEMVRNEETHRLEKLRKKEPMYTVEMVPLDPQKPAHTVEKISTYQGFLDDVIALLQSEGKQFTVHDARLPFPAARLDLMHGFRFSQKDILETALKQNRSGLIGAPTRYGKTILLINTCRAYAGLCTLVAAPGVDLVDQLHDELSTALPMLQVTKLHGKSRKKTQSEHVTVVSFDSLDKCQPEYVRLMCIDEPHALPTDGRIPDFLKFEKARKYGFGATLDGRFDGRDPMVKGLIGPILAERTYLDAVKEGAIAPIVVLMLEIPVQGFRCRDRRKAYQQMMWESERFIRLLSWMLNPVGGLFPPEWQLLAFIENERQVNYLKEHLTGFPYEVAMAKLMSNGERTGMMVGLKNGNTRLCFATNIYAQGVTFSDLRVVINLSGGGATTKSIQKPGRVAELIPGKRCGVMVDFNFTMSPEDKKRWRGSDCMMPIYESSARLKYYEERGFTIIHSGSVNDLVRKFKEHCL